MTPTTDDLKRQMEEIQWYHSIDLGPELGRTNGHCKDDHVRLDYMALPVSFEEKTCLDVGSWDGFFAFEMERRGAALVVASDIWGDYEVKGHQMQNTGAGFDFAHQVLKSNVQKCYSSVYEVDQSIWAANPEIMFDVIVYAGVLYHVQEPVQSLRVLHRLLAPGGLLILETHLDMMEFPRPAIALYTGSECNNDETNFCGPNPPAVEIMLEWAGFQQIDFKGGINLNKFPDPTVVNQARGAWHAIK